MQELWMINLLFWISLIGWAVLAFSAEVVLIDSFKQRVEKITRIRLSTAVWIAISWVSSSTVTACSYTAWQKFGGEAFYFWISFGANFLLTLAIVLRAFLKWSQPRPSQIIGWVLPPNKPR